MTVRVMLIDDHPIVLEGLQIALEAHGLAIVAQARSLAEARSLLTTSAADVALLDLRLPDGSGTELLSDGGHDHGPAFIVLSTFHTPQYVAAAMTLGASGFLVKTAPTAEIVSAVRAVAAGGTAFPRDQIRTGRSRWTPLTKREHAVIAGVLAGRTNDELSTDLHIARKTVESYLTRLFVRYGVLSRTELAILAEREQWLSLPVREGGSRPAGE
jgi:two-component system, NarL family, response regulator DevR